VTLSHGKVPVNPFEPYADQQRWVEWDWHDGDKKRPRTPRTSKGCDTANFRPASYGRFTDCRTGKTGIVLNGDGLVCVDLDGCLDPETQTIEPWAQEWIDKFDTYAEFSPSGTGIKIFLIGDPGLLPKNISCAMPGEPKKDRQGKIKASVQIELFSNNRFLVITNEIIKGCPSEILECREAWQEIVAFVETERNKVVDINSKAPKTTKRTASPYAGRDSAMIGFLGKLRRAGYSQEDAEREADRMNTRGSPLHPNFEDQGPLSDKDMRRIKRSAERFKVGDSGPNGELEEMNEQFCCLRREGGKFRIMSWKDSEEESLGREYVLQSDQEFLKGTVGLPVLVEQPDGSMKTVSRAKWWRSNPGHREYSHLVYEPLQGPVIGDCLNLWQGFGVESQQGDWSLMQNHIFDVLTESNQTYYDYLFNWLADCVQRPDRPGKVVLIFRGMEQQTGKGTLGRAMCRLLGAHGRQVNSSGNITGRFNALLHHCSFLFADEAFYAGDKSGMRALKGLVTEPTITIERKQLEAVRVRNNLHIMMASNERLVAEIEEGDWRFVSFDVNPIHAHDKVYFDALYSQMNDGGYEAMLHDLLHHDLGDWTPSDNIPDTASRDEQKQMSDDTVMLCEEIDSQIERALAKSAESPHYRHLDPDQQEALRTGTAPIMMTRESLRAVLNIDLIRAKRVELVRLYETMRKIGFRSARRAFESGGKNKDVFLRGEGDFNRPYVRLVHEPTPDELSPDKLVYRLSVALGKDVF
jgi:Family of unknown function (DUF5906)